MVIERTPSDNPEVLKAERFLDEVYGEICTWLQDTRGANVIRTFDPQSVDNWDTQSTFPPSTVTFGMQIEKAVVLKDVNNTYGIVLGDRKHSRYDRGEAGSLSLEFGFLPDFDWIRKGPSAFTDIEKLNNLVGPSSLQNRRAEFYYRSDLNKFVVDCWINSDLYGGREIGRWGKSVINPKGREAVVGIVKRLVRNFDPI